LLYFNKKIGATSCFVSSRSEIFLMCSSLDLKARFPVPTQCAGQIWSGPLQFSNFRSRRSFLARRFLFCLVSVSVPRSAQLRSQRVASFPRRCFGLDLCYVLVLAAQVFSFARATLVLSQLLPAQAQGESLFFRSVLRFSSPCLISFAPGFT
jgi:hypothetical protein